jgi:hypothetical protein
LDGADAGDHAFWGRSRAGRELRKVGIHGQMSNLTMALAGIHVVVGVILFGPFLADIVRAGPGAGQAGWSFEMLAAF